MELKQIEYFVKIADYGSISRAAEILYTSQPNVSKVINQLEKELGVKLFKRISSGVVLSDDGKQLYDYARTILTNSKLIKSLASSSKTKKFCVSSYPSNKLSHLFCNLYNKIKGNNMIFEFLEGTVEEVTDNVKEGQSDIGIVYIAASEKNNFAHIIGHKKLEYIELSRAGLCVNVGINNPIYYKEKLSLSDLNSLSFVQPSKDFFSMEHHLEKISLGVICFSDFKNIVNTNSDHVLINLLLETDLCNIGINFLNGYKKQYDIRSIAIDSCETSLSFGYVKRKREELCYEASEFINLINLAIEDKIN